MMRFSMRNCYFLWALLVVWTAALGVSGYRPVDQPIWLMEVAPLVITAPLLVAAPIGNHGKSMH